MLLLVVIEAIVKNANAMFLSSMKKNQSLRISERSLPLRELSKRTNERDFFHKLQKKWFF